MNHITQEFLDELFMVQEKLKNMYAELTECINSNEEWKCKNIATFPGYIDNKDITNVTIKNDKLIIDVYEYNNEACGYDDNQYTYSLNELTNNDWKENAILKYKAELEQKQKEQELHNAKLAKKREDEERAEYERLKAKFEGQM